MKQQILTSALLLVMLSPAAYAQAGIGENYASRDPRTCHSRTAPEEGPLLPEHAAQYVTCELEGADSEYLYLIEDVQVQVGKPRSYNPDMDYLRTDIDVDTPLYPIRGSFKRFQCTPTSSSFYVAGESCNLYDNPEATGTCYKTGFGDWSCDFTDASSIHRVTRGVAPPTGP